MPRGRQHYEVFTALRECYVTVFTELAVIKDIKHHWKKWRSSAKVLSNCGFFVDSFLQLWSIHPGFCMTCVAKLLFLGMQNNPTPLSFPPPKETTIEDGVIMEACNIWLRLKTRTVAFKCNMVLNCHLALWPRGLLLLNRASLIT